MNISAKNEYLKIIDECVKATDSCEINNEGLKILSKSIEKQELLVPVIGAFSMRFTFPDDMDQDKMMREIALGIQRKMMGF